MTLVLSIIAVAPKPSEGSQNSRQFAADGNKAVEAIATMMNEAKGRLPYQGLVERASYIRDIAAVLKKLKENNQVPDILQLCAHGSSGRMEFGRYWTGISYDKDSGYALLDSNPDSYGMLHEHIPEHCKILLLGCSVGSIAPSGYVASGRALLFDLEDMSRADVYAADNLVYPALFDDGFLYRGSLVTSSGKPANPAAIILPPSIIKGPPGQDARGFSEPDKPILTSLLSAPAFGLRGQFEVGVPKDPNFFNSYVFAQQQPSHLLAMAELVFAASNYKRVEAICCLRYLRAENEHGETFYFEAPGSSAPPSSREPPSNAHFNGAKDTLDALRTDAMRTVHTEVM